MISLRSKITQILLNYFFLHKKERLYVNQISRLFNVDRGNLVRKLAELEKEGLLLSEFQGHQRYYFLNKDYPFLKEYESIFNKTVGLESQLKERFSKLNGVKGLYIFGSYARNKMDAHSDIDLLLVGKVDHLEIERIISEFQKKIRREINALDFTEEEYQDKLNKHDPFLQGVLKNKMIQLI